MSCCSNIGSGARLGNHCRLGNLSIPSPSQRRCGMQGRVSIRIPSCSYCLPICCQPDGPECASSLCCPPPTCGISSEDRCPPLCGDSCGGIAPCCPRAAPCHPMIILTTECPKKKCCPRRNKLQEECPPPITWPNPPKIDMCCTTSCPPRRVDICYLKVWPNSPRCFPPDFPCAAKASVGACCKERRC